MTKAKERSELWTSIHTELKNRFYTSYDFNTDTYDDWSGINFIPYHDILEAKKAYIKWDTFIVDNGVSYNTSIYYVIGCKYTPKKYLGIVWEQFV